MAQISTFLAEVSKLLVSNKRKKYFKAKKKIEMPHSGSHPHSHRIIIRTY